MGEVYELGRHRLVRGDCRDPEVWSSLAPPQERALVFDPPYEDVSVRGQRFWCRDALVFIDSRRLTTVLHGWSLPFRCIMTWDMGGTSYITGLPLQRTTHCLWFGESRYDFHAAHHGIQSEPGKLVRTAGVNRSPYEYRLCGGGKHLSTLYAESIGRLRGDHPHEKPVSWVRMLIGNCTRSPAIVDPCAGSGTTLMACEELGRTAYLIEQDPERCEQIVQRWEARRG